MNFHDGLIMMGFNNTYRGFVWICFVVSQHQQWKRSVPLYVCNHNIMCIYIIYIPLNFKPILSYSVTLEFLIELLRSSDPWVLHSEPYPGAGGKMGLSYWSHYICFFPECGAKGSRLTVGSLGAGGVFTRCLGLRPRDCPMAGPLGNAPDGGPGGREGIRVRGFVLFSQD